MAVATKAPGHQAFKPLMNPMDEFALASPAGQQDMEAYLLELQADIINREELLNQREKQFSARELELNEREALLEARKKIIESSSNRQDDTSNSSESKSALDALKKHWMHRMLHSKKLAKCSVNVSFTSKNARIHWWRNP